MPSLGDWLNWRRKNNPATFFLFLPRIFQNAIKVEIHRLCQGFFGPSCLQDDRIRSELFS